MLFQPEDEGDVTQKNLFNLKTNIVVIFISCGIDSNVSKSMNLRDLNLMDLYPLKSNYLTLYTDYWLFYIPKEKNIPQIM